MGECRECARSFGERETKRAAPELFLFPTSLRDEGRCNKLAVPMVSSSLDVHARYSLGGNCGWAGGGAPNPVGGESPSPDGIGSWKKRQKALAKAEERAEDRLRQVVRSSNPFLGMVNEIVFGEDPLHHRSRGGGQQDSGSSSAEDDVRGSSVAQRDRGAKNTSSRSTRAVSGLPGHRETDRRQATTEDGGGGCTTTPVEEKGSWTDKSTACCVTSPAAASRRPSAARYHVFPVRSPKNFPGVDGETFFSRFGGEIADDEGGSGSKSSVNDGSEGSEQRFSSQDGCFSTVSPTESVDVETTESFLCRIKRISVLSMREDDGGSGVDDAAEKERTSTPPHQARSGTIQAQQTTTDEGPPLSSTGAPLSSTGAAPPSSTTSTQQHNCYARTKICPHREEGNSLSKQQIACKEFCFRPGTIFVQRAMWGSAESMHGAMGRGKLTSCARVISNEFERGRQQVGSSHGFGCPRPRTSITVWAGIVAGRVEALQIRLVGNPQMGTGKSGKKPLPRRRSARRTIRRVVLLRRVVLSMVLM